MEKIFRRTLIFLIYIGIVLINTKVYAVQVAYPKNDSVRIREKASTDSAIVTNISNDDKVTVLSQEGDWYKVEAEKGGKKYVGFIRGDLLTIKDEDNDSKKETNEEEEKKEEINNKKEETDSEKTNEVIGSNVANNLDLKEGYKSKTNSKLLLKLIPSINAEAAVEIGPESDYTIIEVLNKWCHIETENQSGWILISKLNSEPKIQEEKENIENKEETVEAVESQKEEKQEVSNQETDEKNENETKKEENKETKTNDVEEKTIVETKYVSVDTLNVREKPNATAQVIDQVDINQKITVLEIVEDSWAKIEVNGKTGYVSNKYLSDKKTVITSRSGETERENQGIENNEPVKKAEDNKATEEITSQKEESLNSKNSTSNSSIGAQVVEYAKQYLGYKYVSGGSSPSSGFDCSGFTCYVFKHFGISLNRVSGAQASNGVAVDRASLQLGDLILFNDNNNSKIGHVGIYIGGNQFIHAANGKKGVVITSLSDSYYTKRYVCARRVI